MDLADALGPTPVRSPAGHCAPFSETARRLEPLLDLVPITRVYDATPIYWLGMPVWAAVTPLARDLTVHAGKGATAEAARLSAVMEAIERVSAESVEPHRIRVSSYSEFEPGDALDPELFDLPFDSAYHPDRELAWVPGHDLIAGRDFWVPLDLAVSPATGGICNGVETNGLAAGNTYVEAILHALYEVIERDAVAHHHFARLYADPAELPPRRLVDLSTLPNDIAVPGGRLDNLTIEDLTHDLGVPVYRATISDASFPAGASRFRGLGADLDRVIAVTRAISEAVQAHTSVLLGARDTFERSHASSDRGSDWLIRQLLRESTVEAFPAHAPAGIADDLYARLSIVLERARLERCVVVDLTRPDLGIPVVRVLVPGLAGPYGDTARRPSLRLLGLLI